MEQSGLTLLRNRWSTFQVGESQVHIGGIDDPMVNWVWGANFPKFEEFRKRMPLTPGPKILLSHRPSVLPLCAQTGIDFTVAGHIHGGQIVLPGMGRGPGKSVAGIASDYTFGWYREGAARMYLNRGVGLTFLPWRINCPPEIAVFHLKQARDGKSGAVRTVPL
jgi:predicted MPP superfamily phosphohydrolase